MFKPKITIVTITYNAERYLEQTITSVIEQTYTNREYIVVDGNSSDGTLDIIKKYESEIDNWISEPDNGIADAMNKGIDLATGDYILFLHSDDCFEHGGRWQLCKLILKGIHQVSGRSLIN